MKRFLIIALVLILSISLFGCVSNRNENTDESDKAVVAKLVEDFGSKLQLVSLLAPVDVVKKSMQDNYGNFVSPALLAKWESNLQDAPGRLTSSPWPDRIEILSNEKLSDNIYEVKGEIIEITSTEKETGGVAAKRPITLTVKKIGNQWLIDDVILGAYEVADSIVYNNTQYGFDFTLPLSWKDYSIINSKWEGSAIEGEPGQVVGETGPIISIRHPKWTTANPRQDIPIMVFTQEQWNLLQQEKFHIGAAPIGPSELGHNTKYVFALPARYNFAFPEGVEEVQKILEGNPLRAYE
jgi:hypothetical protein